METSRLKGGDPPGRWHEAQWASRRGATSAENDTVPGRGGGTGNEARDVWSGIAETAAIASHPPPAVLIQRPIARFQRTSGSRA